MKINLFIPTLNAGKTWHQTLERLAEQTIQFHRKIIVDSGSTDGTLKDPLVGDFEVISIDKRDFDHGGTRQMAVEAYPDADIYLFMTQDAIPANEHTVSRLIQAFVADPELGMAYGRQLPHLNAKTLESHARLFNYPEATEIRGLADAPKYGIKTISCSNSFAAYRKEAFEQAGGFPRGLILGEDVYIAGKMLLKGWKMAYVGEAEVHHSHDYTVKEEFKRYFDIGVFHAESSWIFDHFGRAESRGAQYAKSEISYAMRKNPLTVPKSVASLFAKWLGYKLGLKHKGLSVDQKRKLSMHARFWHSTE
ncbi:rhamnosyltransferase [Echinicola pacifica]|uniref:Rhamnosyltransferase n=1 Tax=Echinicola pacifica TaxID=346377 RepID=A0A918UV84_9BACT|nr:glycosyltransferase family 2 protein [Echinicola pacifica]GGZ37985.1 rhamnosyltransferase [Echinicola pacifica]